MLEKQLEEKLKLDKNSLLESYQLSVSILAFNLIQVMHTASTKSTSETVNLSSSYMLKFLSDITVESLCLIPKTERTVVAAVLVGYATQFYEQMYKVANGQPIDLEEFNIEFNTKDLFDFLKSSTSIVRDRIQFSKLLDQLRQNGIITLHNSFSHIESLGRVKMLMLDTTFVSKFYSDYYHKALNVTKGYANGHN